MSRFTQARRKFSLALAAGVLCANFGLPQAHASESAWPSKPVRLVVPFPAGGSSDALARILAQRLSETFKQNFIVENRPGSGGTIGTSYVARAPADGSVLLVGAGGSLVVSPLLTKQNYDTLRDFEPITQLISSPMAVAINREAFGDKVNTIPELVEAIKAQDGVPFASGGDGTQMHLSGELLNELTQANMVHVPYKGAAAAITDLIGGHVPVAFVDLASIVPMMDDERIKVLGIANTEPSKVRPELPTSVDAAMPQWKAGGWIGLLAPAGTPEHIVKTLEEHVTAIVQEQEIIDRIMTTGNEPNAAGREKFIEHITQETALWKGLIERVNVQM